MAVDLEVDAEMLLGLRRFTDASPSTISPWHGADTPVTDAVRARLTDAGAIDDTGARRELQPTLAALAAATATTSLRFAGAGALLMYAVWMSPDHDPIGLSAIEKPGCFRLEDPAPTGRVVELAAALVGRSPLRGLELALDLSIADALALAAIIDVQRHMILRVLANGGDADGQVDVADLRGVLDAAPSSGISMVAALQRVCGPASESADALAEAVASLSRQGLIDGDSSAFRLAGPCAELAQRFAAITALVELANACDVGADGVARYACACLQAGVSDLLSIEWVKTGIHIETVSADTVLGYIERLLCEPNLATRSVAISPAQPREARAARAEPTTDLPVPTRPMPEKPPWRPTHLVPAGGMPAWAEPDGANSPIARIDPGVELQIVGRYREFARIRCSNGWEAWVDVRAMETREAAPTQRGGAPVQRGGAPVRREAEVQRAGAPMRREAVANRTTQVTLRERVPEATAKASVWRPTHVVPEGGMPAWSNPDATARPSAKIDPLVELQLLERRGDWAHILCSNGWSAWVDGRAIKPLPTAPR